MSTKKTPSENALRINKILYWVLFGFILVIAVGFRFLSYNSVITDNTVNLKGADAYFFTREAQLIRTNGSIPSTDSLICYPDGFKYDQSAGLYPVTLAFMGNFMPLEFATAISSPLFAGLLFLVVFFLLRELFKKNDYAVLGGLAVVSFMGIQFISRSYFGFGDRHVLETLLFTLGLFGFVKAINRESYKWIIVSAIGFALYNYSWAQASLMLLLFGVGALITILFKDKISPKMLKFLIIIYAVQLIPALLFSNAQLLGISIGLIATTVFANFIRLKFKVKWQRLLIMLAGIGIVLLLASLLFKPFYTQLTNVIDSYANPKGNGPSVSEAAPMFSIYNSIQFGDTVFLQLVAMAIGLYGLYLAYKKQNFIFFLIGIALAVLSFIRIRSEYYFIIFAGFGVAYAIDRFKNLVYIIIACVILFFIQYVSAWSGDLAAQRSSLAFSNADYKMGAWMKENLPANTFTDNNVADYGVLADWPLGYLYTYVSNKPLLAEPNFCHYLEPVKFYIMQTESDAYKFMKLYKLRYVLVKPIDLNKYYNYLTQLGVQKQMMAVQGTVAGVQKLFVNQNYFQSIGVRLYNFEGKAVTPTKIYTINANKQLSEFTSFELAKEQGGTNYFSMDTNSSPVPLDALQHFKLIHSEVDTTGGVKLFEVID